MPTKCNIISQQMQDVTDVRSTHWKTRQMVTAPRYLTNMTAICYMLVTTAKNGKIMYDDVKRKELNSKCDNFCYKLN